MTEPVVTEPAATAAPLDLLQQRIARGTAKVALMGLGYAGLPMAVEFARAGLPVLGFDVDERKVAQITRGRSPVTDVPESDLAPLVDEGRLAATSDFGRLRETEAIVICVPTPLGPDREPDLSYVVSATESILPALDSAPKLVVLQSTTYPGTTREVLLPILARNGHVVGEDFLLAMAPERIDPGNQRFTVRNTPKLVGGITPRCSEAAGALFAHCVDQVEPVASPEVAEMAKLVENSFRFINISFANEVALLCDRLGVSVWDVLAAADSKPFAFLRHNPGPGVGGHCIPISPYYLQAATRRHGLENTLIAAAGQVNDAMPGYVLDRLERLLTARGQALGRARVLVLGVAYKPDVADLRVSPALPLLDELRQRGADVAYSDPYVPVLELESGAGTPWVLSSVNPLVGEPFDVAVLITAHRAVPYARILERVGALLDTRNALGALDSPKVVAL